MSATDSPTATPRRWSAGPVLASVDGISPLLASWERHEHPAQVRMRAYLDDLQGRLGMERLPAQGLFLDLLVDVQRPDRLMKHYDVENYLTPLAGRLGWQRFVMAVGRKRVGGGSRVSVGIARASPPESRKFVTAVVDAGSGSTTGQWKSRLRDSVAALEMPMLPPGPVALELSWRCSPALNWVALWKPTGDAMGSILGEPDSRNPFNVADDRIVSLTLHRDIDPAMGRGVHVGFFLPRSR